MKGHYILLVILLFLVVPALGQPGGGGGGPGSGDPVPISGIEFLIAAGGLLGLRKYLRAKKAE